MTRLVNDIEYMQIKRCLSTLKNPSSDSTDLVYITDVVEILRTFRDNPSAPIEADNVCDVCLEALLDVT
jgi:hypothetical protein